MRSGSRRLTRFSRVVAALCLFLLFAVSASADHTSRTLWVSADQSVFEVSPVDGVPALELGDLPDVKALAVDQRTDHIWIYNRHQLQAYDAQGNQLVDTTLPYRFDDDQTVALAVDGKANNVWLAQGHRLYRFDLTGQLKAQQFMRRAPTAMTVDSTRSDLWIAEDDGLVVLDQTGTTVATADLRGIRQEPETISYDASLDQVWVAFDGGIARYDHSGNQVFSAPLKDDLDDFMAPDGQGNIWLADGSTLVHVNRNGTVDFALHPFSDLNKGEDYHRHTILGLVADPLNHSVWVASRRYLQQYGSDSTLLQTVDSQTWLGNTTPGRGGRGDGDGRWNWNNWGWFGRGYQGVHDLALYVDTIPPTVSITSPSDGIYTNHNRPEITLSYADIGSGVDVTQTKITTADGVAVPTTCTATAANDGATCTPNTALSDGHYTLSVTVTDYAGNVSKPTTVSLTVDTVPPTITITNPTKSDVDQAQITLTGAMSEAGTLAINGSSVPLSTSFQFSDAVTFKPGNNTVTLVGADLAGNVTTLTKVYDYELVPPAPDGTLIAIADPINGSTLVTGKTGAVEAGDIVVITNTVTDQNVTVTANADGSFSTSIAAGWGDPIAVVAKNPADTDEQSPATQTQAGSLPPNPQSVAPSLTPSGEMPFSQSTAFLYSGASPVQIGVAANTMQPARVAVIRGIVEDAQGKPLSGAVITILNHPEYGYTVSRADGMFDMAVNGGQSYIVVYNKSGYLPAQRQVHAPWRAYARVPEVALIPPSIQVNAVTFGSGAPQFVSGATSSDADGARTPSLFIPAGTTATMTLPDGSQTPLAAAHLRMTEYTVGSNGQQAMPAELPQYTSYTYALDYQLDEATQQKATQTVFSSPVYAYVTNFLKLPVGAYVPSGWYDENGSKWVPSDNGLVVQILGVDATGAAILDVNGNGQPATASALAALGVTTAELDALAKQYQPGTSFWRVPLKHFCIYDYNLAALPQDIGNIEGQPASQSPETPQPGPCVRGCIVGPLHQTLGEVIPVTGASQTLDYSSANVSTPGSNGRTLIIPVTGPDNKNCAGQSCFGGLESIELDIDVEGEHFAVNIPPYPNQTYTFVWDGKDGYGRKVYGSVPVYLTEKFSLGIQYVYFHPQGDPLYQPPEFGTPGWSRDQYLTVVRTSHTVDTSSNLGPYYVSDTTPTYVLAPGWNLSSDAWYDDVAGVLHNGDGSTRDIDAGSPWVLPYSYAAVGYGSIAVGPDGAAYASQGADIIAVINPGGFIQQNLQPVASLPSGSQIGMLRMGPDGNLYALDTAHGLIDSVTTAGTVTTVASNLQNARSFAILPGGGFVVAECGQLVEVGTDGQQTVIAGQGCNAAGAPADGASAIHAAVDPLDIATDQSGDIYFIQPSSEPNTGTGDTVDRISGADGTITVQYSATVQTSQFQLTKLSRLAYMADGEVGVINDGQVFFLNKTGEIIARTGNAAVAPTHQGHTIPNTGTPVAYAYLFATGLAMAPDNTVEVIDSVNGLVDIRSNLPVQNSDEYQLASMDGSRSQTFDDMGRIQKLLNAYTGATLKTYQYNAAGQLIGETDAFGRTLTITRDASGYPTAITSPDGQTTKLQVNSNGNLVSVTDPAGDTWNVGYQDVGLINRFTDPRGETDQYSYDAQGRLTQVQEPNGGGWSITRSDYGPSSYSILLKSGEGRVTKYDYNPDNAKWVCEPVDGLFRTNCMSADLYITAPDGSVTSESDPSWGSISNMAAADGTFTSISYDQPDVRFGSASPLPRTTITIPYGSVGNYLTHTTSLQRTADWDPVNYLHALSFTQITTTNNETSETDTYDGTNMTWTHITPMYRNIVTHTNTLGQPTELDMPGVEPITYTYDSAGRLAGLSQGSGTDARTSTYTYYSSGPSKGLLQQMTDPLGLTVSYQYDAAGRVTMKTLPDGEEILSTYDADGNLTSITPPSRPAHSFDYTPGNRIADYTPPSVSGVSNPATQYQYNLDKQLKLVTDPDGETVDFAYDAGGRLSTITLPTGTYQYAYAPVSGQLQSITSPDAETLGYSWAGSLNIGNTWSGLVTGSVTRTYDNYFRVTSLAVDGNAVNYKYNFDGLITTEGDLVFSRDAVTGFVVGTAMDGIQSSRTYDTFGAPATVQYETNGLTGMSVNLDHTVVTKTPLLLDASIPGAGSISVNGQTYFLNDSGDLTASIPLQQGNNPISINVYDASGKVVYTAQKNVTLESSTSNNSVNKVLAVGPDGTVYYDSGDGSSSPLHLFTPGSAGSMQPVWLQNAINLAFGPGGAVYLVKIAANGDDQLWIHDVSGDRETIDFPNTFISQMAITSQGHMVFTDYENLYGLNSDGTVTTLFAFNADRIWPVQMSSSAWGIAIANTNTGDIYQLQADGSLVLVENEPFNNQVGVNFNSFAVDGNGQFCFNFSQVLINYSGVRPAASTASLPPNVWCHQPGAPIQYYSLVVNPLTMVFDSSNQLYVNDYSNIYTVSGDNLTGLLSGGAVISGTLSISGSSGQLFSEQYTRDKLGRITEKVETVNGTTTTWNYSYDKQGRLASVSQDGTVVETDGYDANGNRTTVNGSVVGTYDNQDRVLTFNGDTYTYTQNGEVKTDTWDNGDGTSSTQSYNYDAAGHLTDVVTPDGTKVHYILDGQDRRVGKEVNGTLVQGFLYQNKIAPVAELDGSGNVIQQYIYGSKPNVPDYIIEGASTYRIITDQLGSVHLVVNAQTGQIMEQIDYDTWGNEISDTNPGFQPFGFAGGIFDQDTFEVHFGARDYDPSSSRWLEKDPTLFSGGDLNLYGYALSNPINFIDDSGLFGSPIHFELAFYAGLQSGFSISQSASIAASDVGVDFRTTSQSAANANMHGMAQPGQSVESAMLGDQTIVNNALANGDIGLALHATEDPFASGHDYKEWDGSFSSMSTIDVLEHIIGDWFPAPWRIRDALEADSKVLELYKHNHCLN